MFATITTETHDNSASDCESSHLRVGHVETEAAKPLKVECSLAYLFTQAYLPDKHVERLQWDRHSSRHSRSRSDPNESACLSAATGDK